MKKIIWGAVFAATAIVACVMVYEDLLLDRGIYGGEARYSFTLVIGEPPGPRYGIERESYWIDQAGECVIPYLDPRSIPPGYKHHVCANLLVGDLSLPLPLRPWADATLALLAVGALGWFYGIHRAQPRTQSHEAAVAS
jgi:hypothetical protein